MSKWPVFAHTYSTVTVLVGRVLDHSQRCG